MKILKIFGIVVGIHVFALILIFANPGCSSSTRPATTPPETAARTESAPQITAPTIASGNASLIAAPPHFNPDAPAVAASGGSGGFRGAPTRPGTPAANVLVAEPVAAEVTPVTTHVVVGGDNLWNLSKKHGITSAQLAAANNLKTTATLKPGQKLIIPGKAVSASGATTAPTAPVATKAGNEAAAKASPNQLKHTVQPGEVLGTIARRYGVTVGEIATLNNIANPAKITPGTELLIPDWQPVAKSGKAGQKSDTTKATPSAKGAAQTPSPLVNPERESPPRINEIPVIPVDDSPLTPAPRR